MIKAQKPLNEIIKSQFVGLNDLSKSAYCYACVFSQFGQPINIELLVRTLDCGYEEFINEVIHKDASKIIFQEKDVFDNLLFRTHHKIIAQKTLEFFFPDSKQQFEIFIKLFNNVTEGNLKEIQLCENIIIKHLTSKSNKFFSTDQKRKFFEISCERYPTRSLYHHWGLLEMKETNFEIAEKLLREAIDFENTFDAYRGESDQNILTTLGNLYSSQGLIELQRGHEDNANEMFIKAEKTFEQAKHGEFPNVHAYHSHSYMWLKKAKDEKDENKKLEFLTQALEITSIAKDNINEDELQAIFELETTLWSFINDEKKIQEFIIVLKEKYNSSKGYFLAALCKCNLAGK